MDLPYEKQFHFHDGTSVGSVEQLAKRLESISYQEFYRHVNPDKNDFASWIRHVLHEDALADELQSVTSIVETVEILNDFLHPRPVTAPRTDLQSQIEDSIFGGKPLAAGAPIPVEEVPTTTPAVETDTAAVADFRIIQENLEQPKKEEVRPQQPAVQDHDTARLIVKDFMYGVLFGLVVGILLGRLIAI